MAELSFRSYYLNLEPTGAYDVDLILSAVARAGKAYHSTEFWNEDTFDEAPFVGDTWSARIQNAAISATATIAALEAALLTWWTDFGDEHYCYCGLGSSRYEDGRPRVEHKDSCLMPDIRARALIAEEAHGG